VVAMMRVRGELCSTESPAQRSHDGGSLESHSRHCIGGVAAIYTAPNPSSSLSETLRFILCVYCTSCQCRSQKGTSASDVSCAGGIWPSAPDHRLHSDNVPCKLP
jgi:hypothetical protein